jgi:ABC-type uncharacterized transport system fused permease/ATPase subunit
MKRAAQSLNATVLTGGGRWLRHRRDDGAILREIGMRRLTTLGRDVWSLARGYWSSEERWSARLLLVGIIGLKLGMVYASVLFNTARDTMYNGLQARDAAAFCSAFGTIVVLILAYVAVALLRYYLYLTALKPDWLFLDEATSAIDEDQEEILYRALTSALPGTTIVSIGHRRSLAVYHDRGVAIERRPGRLIEGLLAA